MKWLIAGLVGAVALFMVIDTGFGIRCYECNSYFQHDCADFFNNKTFNLVQCPAGVTMCRKIVQEVYYNDDWNVRYIRQCAPTGDVNENEGRDCTERTGTYRVKMRYCQCNNQEGCNGASSVSMPLMMVLVPALTTLGLIYKNL